MDEKNVWEVEIDGEVYEIEGGDMPPTETEAREALSSYEKPKDTTIRKFYPRTGVELEGFAPKDILASTIVGSARDIAQPGMSFLNQFLLNAPSSLMRKAGIEYPSEKDVVSPVAKVASYGAGIAGGFKNPLIKAAARASTMGKAMLRGALAGAAYSPEDITNIEQRALQGALGAVVPPIGKGAIGAGKAIGNISKTGINYITENIAKPVAQKINFNIRYNPEIARGLNIKQDTIDLIKKHGYDKVADVEGAKKLADEAFDIATNQETAIYGNKIDIQDTLSKMRSVYAKLKGTNRQRLGDIIQRLKEMQPAPKGFAKDAGEAYTYSKTFPEAKVKGQLPTKTQYFRAQAGEPYEKIAKEVRITRHAFSALRSDLNDLYGQGYDDYVLSMVDSLYNDAEKSGLKGMQQARRLFSEYKQFQKVAKDLTKIEKLDATKIQADISSIIADPKKSQLIVDKYTPYLGKVGAQKLVNDALEVRSGEVAKRNLKRLGWTTLVPAAFATGYGLNRMFR